MTKAHTAYRIKEAHSFLTAIVPHHVVEHLGHLQTILGFNDWYNTEAHWDQAIDQH